MKMKYEKWIYLTYVYSRWDLKMMPHNNSSQKNMYNEHSFSFRLFLIWEQGLRLQTKLVSLAMLIYTNQKPLVCFMNGSY